MKRKVEIIFDVNDNKGSIAFLLDGKPIPNMFGYNLQFNGRENELKFTGKRLTTNETGQYFIDEKGETATEELDLLKYFSDEETIKEMIRTAKQGVELALSNIRQTSVFNAIRMIANRLGVE